MSYLSFTREISKLARSVTRGRSNAGSSPPASASEKASSSSWRNGLAAPSRRSDWRRSALGLAAGSSATSSSARSSSISSDSFFASSEISSSSGSGIETKRRSGDSERAE